MELISGEVPICFVIPDEGTATKSLVREIFHPITSGRS